MKRFLLIALTAGLLSPLAILSTTPKIHSEEVKDSLEKIFDEVGYVIGMRVMSACMLNNGMIKNQDPESYINNLIDKGMNKFSVREEIMYDKLLIKYANKMAIDAPNNCKIQWEGFLNKAKNQALLDDYILERYEFKLDPNNSDYSASTFLQISEIYNRKGDYNERIKYLDKAEALEPSSFGVLFQKGNLYLDKKDYKKAILYYEKSNKIKPNAKSYNNIGLIKKHYMNDLKGAFNAFNEAIKFNPTLAISYSNRAAVKEDLGDIDGAIADHNKAIELDGSNYNLYFNRAQFFFHKKNNIDKYCSDLDKASRLVDKEAKVLINENCNNESKQDR